MKPRRKTGKRLTSLERYQVLDLHRKNPHLSFNQISDIAQCSVDTVRTLILAANKTVIDLMACDADARLEDWRTASEISAKRGDHRPAKEWLLHSGALDQLPDTGKGNGPAVVIINSPLPGMPGGVTIGSVEGVHHALEAGQFQEGHQPEHQDRDRGGQAAEASRRDRPEHGS